MNADTQPQHRHRRSHQRHRSSRREHHPGQWRKIGSWALFFTVIGGILLWIGAYGPPAPAVRTRTGDTAVLVHLPRDDAPHDNYIEWWYYNGHLHAADGRDYSFHYVFFVVNSLVSYTAAHVALTDHQTLKRSAFQQASSGHPSYGARESFNFTLTDWLMTGSDGHDTLKVKTQDFAFDLQLESTRPPVFQGGTGLLDFKQAGSSYYYTRPRMRISGTLSTRGKPLAVTGEAWFDHQWGDFRTAVLGWTWFALQLDDGADIMLYQLHDERKRLVLFSGTYTQNGRTEVLSERDMSISPTASWTSKVTGIPYATAWNVRLLHKGIDVKVAAVAQDAEVDARQTTYNIYWEGAVKVSGSHAGKGFLEISSAGLQKKPADAKSKLPPVKPSDSPRTMPEPLR